MSNITREYTVKVTVEGKLSRDNLHKAIFLFESQNGSKPETLNMHYSAYRDILDELDRNYYDLETIMGLKKNLDPLLPVGQWNVSSTDSKVYAIQ